MGRCSRRDLGESRLRGSKLLGGGEDQDPMSGLCNLMDVMLVFACGLMLAIIANWNVDLNEVQASGGSPAVKEIEGDLEAVEEGIAADDGSYTEMGTVYRDEETGDLYVVTG